MTLERLWAGWRAEYMEAVTTSPPPDECLFCSLAVASSDDEALIIDRNDLVYAVLNAYPYTSGHLMVVPVRHEGRLEALTDEEARALLAMLQRATSVVQAAYHT